MAGIFDRRRIQAPESSYTPTFSQEQQSSSSRSSSTRPICKSAHVAGSCQIVLKTGLISQANGSGYIEAGKVKIACSVYGPRPKQPPYSPQGSLNLEIKFAPFASHPRRAPLRVSLDMTCLTSGHGTSTTIRTPFLSPPPSTPTPLTAQIDT